MAICGDADEDAGYAAAVPLGVLYPGRITIFGNNSGAAKDAQHGEIRLVTIHQFIG